MEPRDRAASTLTEAPERSELPDLPELPGHAARSRFRLAAASLLLVGLAMVQDPGFLVPDTKFDLVMAPGDFLGRALHLWDAEGAFGQLQNQAYGYLWPMGPVFWVGDLLDVPGWVVQRSWLALVLVVALVGTTKLARALGVRSDLACLVAGFAFALSPRMLTVLGPISIEAWPSAVAPWVLLALVHGSRSGSPRLWAATAGLGVAMVGGVNAAATFAVIPLGAVWLLTRSPGPRRRSLMLWWPVFTVLGTAWWLVPLFVMGAYSPPFLDFIETTAVTTFPTTLFDALRGTSDWVPYIDPASRAGNDLITTPYLVLNSGLLLVGGLAGLADRRLPERGFLAASVLVGLVMVTAGHTGAVEGWGSGAVRDLLDGGLAPLRNVHKFDVVLRLPLVLALAWVLDRVVTARSRSTPESVLERVNRVSVTAVVLLAVVGSTGPALAGRLTPGGAVLDVPQYWSQSADWLAQNDPGTALVVPGARFANYIWGAPRDEPLQYLASSPWAVRNVIPLTPTGNIRMLDEIERRLAEGDGSPGLAAYLRRAGVQHVVVRNDLATDEDVPVPVLVHQAVRETGLVRVASFGPDVGGGPSLLPGVDGSRFLVNSGWQDSYPAVEIFEVPGEALSAVSAETAPVVVGGPEDLLDLADLGVLGDAPVRLAADLDRDETPAGAPLVLTDGLRDRERFFARIHDGYSAVRVPGERRRTTNPARDYSIADDRWSTQAGLLGADSVGASSSMSDADAPGGARHSELPAAAVDGSRATQWVSVAGATTRAAWRLDLTDPESVDSVDVVGGSSAPDNQVVVVRTAHGDSEPVEVGPDQEATVAVPAGTTSWVEVREASGSPGRPVALAEVALRDMEVQRELVTPQLPGDWPSPDAVVLRADRDDRRGCVDVSGDVRCTAVTVRSGEESESMRRAVRLPVAALWQPDIAVVPRESRELNRYIQRQQPVRILASSTGVDDPRAGPVSAIDGEPGTTWTAAVDDLRPTLTLNWLGQQSVTGIDLSVADGTAARAPTELRLTWPGGTRLVTLRSGRTSFAPIVTDQLTVRVEESARVLDLGFDSEARPVPVGITELDVTGVPYLPLRLSTEVARTGCGAGPSVEVNGALGATFVEASPVQLQRGEAVRAGLCDAAADSPRAEEDREVALLAGGNDITLRGTRAFAPGTVVLRRVGGLETLVDPTPATESGDAVHRRVQPADAGARVIGLRQNANLGWQAESAEGVTLRPVVLDGWQQGWLADGLDAPVTARFDPDGAYRTGLLGGAVALLLLLAGVLLAWLRRVRSQGGDGPPALAGRALAPWIGVPAGLVVAGVVAGTTGLVVMALGLLLARCLISRDAVVAPWLLAAPCLAVAAAYAVTPWGDISGWAGSSAWTAYVMLVPLAGVVVGATRSGDHRFFSRRAGRSTSR